LADSPFLEGLEYLDLSGNDISEAGATRLKARYGDRVHF
jgi:hypothetical protein